MNYQEPNISSEVVDIENWRNPEEQSFNRQALVMTAVRRCIETGAKEMKEGYWDEKVDKHGNVARTYHEDTRKCFIESVKTLIMMLSCDFDDDATNKITLLAKEIEDKKKYWLNEEWRWWCSLTTEQRKFFEKQGKYVTKGFFNSKLNFDNYFFEDELNLYRQICTELISLTKRNPDYRVTDYIV